MRDDGRTVRWIAAFTSVAMDTSDKLVSGMVELKYRVRDPFAVTAAFRTSPDRRVTWTFARELLADGLKSASGAGDVRVEPWRSSDRVLITLRSRAGRTLVTVSRKDITGFLDYSYRLVPEGQESACTNIDRELVKLLA